MTFFFNSLFPNYLKLHKSSEFKEIFEKGKKLKSDHFTVFYHPNSLGFPRVGIVLLRKKVSSAVKRNRIKRLIREFFRNNKRSFNSLDLLFYLRKKPDNPSLKSIENEIREKIITHLS